MMASVILSLVFLTADPAVIKAVSSELNQAEREAERDGRYDSPEPAPWMLSGLFAAVGDARVRPALWRLDSLSWLLEALPADDPRAPAVVTALRQAVDVPAAHETALRTLRKVRPGPWNAEVVDVLLANLKPDGKIYSEYEPDPRAGQIEALPRFLPWGARSDEYISLLLNELDPKVEPDPVVRAAAASTLGRLPEGPRTKEIADALFGCFGAPGRTCAENVGGLINLPRAQWTDDHLRLVADYWLYLIPFWHRDDAARIIDATHMQSLLEAHLSDWPSTSYEVSKTLSNSPIGLWDSTINAFIAKLGNDSSFEAELRLRFAAPGPFVENVIREIVDRNIRLYNHTQIPLDRGELLTAKVLDAAFSQRECTTTAQQALYLLERFKPRNQAETNAWLTGLLQKRDEQESDYCRYKVAEILGGRFFSHRTDNIPILLGRAVDVAEVGLVRSSSITALARITHKVPAKAVTDALIEAMKRDPNGRHYADTLGGFATAGDAIFPLFLKAPLADGYLNPLRMLAGADRPATSHELLQLLAGNSNRDEKDRLRVRALAFVLSGGTGHGADPDSLPLLALLGGPAPINLNPGDKEAAHQIMLLLDRRWDDLPVDLRAEAAHVLASVAEAACSPSNGRSVCWNEDQAKTVSALSTKLEPSHRVSALVLSNQLEAPPPQSGELWVDESKVALGVLLWVTFWFAFIVAFPWSTLVQAAFLYNPHVRRYLSLGIVPLLLLVVRPLRRRLLSPFRDELVAAANLGEFEGLNFFEKVRSQSVGGAPQQAIELLQNARGVVVLRGEAGLGKTSILRRLASTSSQPVAFLHARDCKSGVVEAIEELIQQVQDKDFVRGMIHAGTLSVIIDGLNEVSPEIRVHVTNFARRHPKRRILIATQPIEWTPPHGAQIVDLLPLNRVEATKFLESRLPDEHATVKDKDYRTAVAEFLRRALDDETLDPDERRANELVLSNPFDLDFAADLLAHGAIPRPVALIDEAFRMAEHRLHSGYRARNGGQAFPLVKFGRHATEMRKQDRNWLESGEFETERPCLLANRLLVTRAVQGKDGKDESRNVFRHERVWDFFIAAAFKVDHSLMEASLGDARFRGVYLRIADTWPPEHAKVVRDRLVEIAAQTNDNTTSNEFVRRLMRPRPWMYKPPPSPIPTP